MRVHIVFQFKETGSGGGNQFLKALQRYLKSRDMLAGDAEDADIVLFNSYQYIPEVIRLKERFGTGKIFVHRIDGPIREYNLASDKRDFVTNSANQAIADATIFQSGWSRKANLDSGLKRSPFEAVIMNAPDPAIFNRDGKAPFSGSRKTRLVASSWSPNWKKGFGIYRWLDENLDFGEYEMTFIGNSPVGFRNIRALPPSSSEEVARAFKGMDIYLTASQKDPCSNSLIEAMHCGLPAVALADGGHPDIVGRGGELFSGTDTILESIRKVRADYSRYQGAIDLPTMDSAGKLYADFLQSLLDAVREGRYQPKRLGALGKMGINGRILQWRISEKVGAFSAGKRVPRKDASEARA